MVVRSHCEYGTRVSSEALAATGSISSSSSTRKRTAVLETAKSHNGIRVVSPFYSLKDVQCNNPRIEESEHRVPSSFLM